MILTQYAELCYLQVNCMAELSPNVFNNDVIVKDLLMTDVVVEKLSKNAERSNRDSGKCLNY